MEVAGVTVVVTVTRVGGATVVVSTTVDVEIGTGDALELLLEGTLRVETTEVVDVAVLVMEESLREEATETVNAAVLLLSVEPLPRMKPD